MIRSGVIPIAIALLSLQLASAKDFQKSYTVSAGLQVIIENNLGNIKLTGHKGKAIELTAYRKGTEGDAIGINDETFPDGLRIYSRYGKFPSPKEFVPPKSFGPPGRFTPPQPFPPRERFERPDASVDMEILIPQSMEYRFVRLVSFNGKVEISGVTGPLWARSERGSVEVKDVRGSVNASSVSGHISALIGQARDRGDMRFVSFSGSVEVRAPANLDASVEMWSRSGLIKTDFPIEIKEERYGPAKSAKGILKLGGRKLLISSVSGPVSLIRK